MKKLFSLIALTGFLFFAANLVVNAQDDSTKTNSDPKPAVVDKAPEVAAEGELSAHQVLKQKFIEGEPQWMAPVLICLILGLALCIERIIYLNMSTTNSQKFLLKVESELERGGVEAAKELCRNSRGPVASITYQALLRVDEGRDDVEKAIVSYGSVQNGKLETGLPWLALFIALAPMLGFLGTVVGMILAFDMIGAANTISPAVVADGIKVALLTTVAGLIVAIILQIFYNYILSKIDGIVNDMEDASISIMDILIKNKVFSK